VLLSTKLSKRLEIKKKKKKKKKKKIIIRWRRRERERAILRADFSRKSGVVLV
jgi:hypothetical protein